MQPSHDDVFGVLVTHEPDDGVARRVTEVAPALAGILVVDNGSTSDAALRTLESVERLPGVEIIRNETNLGLATALNQGLGRSRAGGTQWTLLLDQDSEPLPGLVDSLVHVARTHPRPARLAVVGTNYVEPSGRLHARLADDEWRPVPSVISSGSIVSTAAVVDIGPLRDGLFIDYVDHEFCLRARAAGWEIALAGHPGLRHGIGRVTRHRLGPLAGGASHHAVSRRYYRTRNQLFVYARYGWREPRWLARDASQSIRSVVQMCLFERERVAKLRAMLAGVRDACLGRDGRCER